MPLLPLGGLLPCFQSATPNLHIVLCVFCVSLTHYNVLLCVCGCAFVIPCSNSRFSTGEGGWCGKWGENRFPISGCVGWGKHTTSISSWRSSSVKRYVPFRLLDHRHTHTHTWSDCLTQLPPLKPKMLILLEMCSINRF